VRILSLHTDAFGNIGGIAQYNQDLLTAVAEHPRIDSVLAMPFSKQAEPLPALPAKVDYKPRGPGGKVAYLARVTRETLSLPRFDLILCAHVNLLVAGVMASVIHQAPLLVFVYGIEVWEPTPYRIVNTMIGRIDATASISAISRKRMDGWANLTDTPSYIIPNAIDAERFTPGPKPDELLDRYGLHDRKVMMTAGRLDPRERYKGVDEVLELMPSLIEQEPTLAYLIVGDGDDRQRLTAKAKQLGIQDRVIFTGWVDESEKVDHYRIADAYVMPGRGEGFGFVYLEALACGIPIVASKVDGSREAARDGMLGCIVDPDDHDEIRQAILDTLAKPRGVVAEGLSYFYYDSFVQRCHTMLDEIIARGRR